MIAWLLYGSLEERTGGTIYDRIIVEGLRARGLAVAVIDPRIPTNALMQELVRARIIVGDELCFRELAFVFPRVPDKKRVLLVHHLTCWEEERTRAERQRARVREAQSLRAADVIVTTSEATRARLEREGCRGAMHVVRPGSDRLARAAHGGREPRRFLFVGAVTARKRVRELIRALPPGTELRVLGSIHREKRYADEVRAAAPHVTFLGEVDDARLARELASADALVLPSSLEGYGIAATEAIHAGLPVIASRTPGLEEALASCPSAVLFARTDSSDLAPALHELATNEALRTRMRAAAEVARLPSWADAVERFASLVT